MSLLTALRVRRYPKVCVANSLAGFTVPTSRSPSKTMVQSRSLALVLILLSVVVRTGAAGADLQAQAQLVMKSPDIRVSGTFELATRPELLDKMLDSPIILARLWEIYQFSPAYKVSLRGDGIHVEDPTGIAGDIFLVEKSGNRRVYLGIGALNHALVPAFRGKMALVLTSTPKGAGTSAHIDVYVRTDSRVIGFLAWTLGPLLRPRVENRMAVNADMIGTILKDLSAEPRKAAALLNTQDAAALLKILQPPSTKRQQPPGPK